MEEKILTKFWMPRMSGLIIENYISSVLKDFMSFSGFFQDLNNYCIVINWFALKYSEFFAIWYLPVNIQLYLYSHLLEKSQMKGTSKSGLFNLWELRNTAVPKNSVIRNKTSFAYLYLLFQMSNFYIYSQLKDKCIHQLKNN